MATVVTTGSANGGGRGFFTGRKRGVGTEPTFGAWGTGAGTAAAADTTLFTESAEARATGTSSQVTTTTTNDTWQLVWTQTASAGRAITNAGNFDASSTGNLDVKGDFSTINLATNDSITFTLKIQVS